MKYYTIVLLLFFSTFIYVACDEETQEEKCQKAFENIDEMYSKYNIDYKNYMDYDISDCEDSSTTDESIDCMINADEISDLTKCDIGSITVPSEAETDSTNVDENSNDNNDPVDTNDTSGGTDTVLTFFTNGSVTYKLSNGDTYKFYYYLDGQTTCYLSDDDSSYISYTISLYDDDYKDYITTADWDDTNTIYGFCSLVYKHSDSLNDIFSTSITRLNYDGSSYSSISVTVTMDKDATGLTILPWSWSWPDSAGDELNLIYNVNSTAVSVSTISNGDLFENLELDSIQISSVEMLKSY